MTSAFHQEVVEALKGIGDPKLGSAIAKDRGSQLEYFGVRFPALRRRVKQGFSFSSERKEEVLGIWDELWRMSPYGDVLFAALEYVDAKVRRCVDPSFWPVVRGWSDRVDNWCHCDMLGGIYSRILEADHEIYAQLESWNATEDLWLRRLSLVSHIHYSGKNAVFLPPGVVLPLVSTCVSDHRHYVETAVGWVLREMGHAYPSEVVEFIEREAVTLGAKAFSRAIEGQPDEVRERLRARRRQGSVLSD